MGKVLVTGANGQLGSEIRALVFSGAKAFASHKEDFFLFTEKTTLDITDPKAIETFIAQNDIDTIVNCAAYTAVDKAETDEANADLINHIAVKNIAEIARERALKLVHISTDYVFDGQNYKPYTEEDRPNPTGVYGKTKLAGEKAILETAPKNTVIIRTSWVYSSFGNNFVKTMLKLGREREELGVIYDQIGTPTYAGDLAEAIVEILPKIDNAKPEIYHYSNEGAISWYSIVTKHNGSIDVQSEKGKGSTFTIMLPASSEQEETSEGPGQPVKGKILVMDDEDIVLKMCQEILIALGYAATIVSSGKEAVTSYEQAMKDGNPFHAAILDITIPGGMGGEETAAAILRIDPQAKLIVSSGYATSPIISSPADYGFCDVLVKPYQVQVLAETLERTIAKG